MTEQLIISLEFAETEVRTIAATKGRNEQDTFGLNILYSSVTPYSSKLIQSGKIQNMNDLQYFLTNHVQGVLSKNRTKVKNIPAENRFIVMGFAGNYFAYTTVNSEVQLQAGSVTALNIADLDKNAEMKARGEQVFIDGSAGSFCYNEKLNYLIDGYETFQNPTGRRGKQLEATYYVTFVQKTLLNSVCKALEGMECNVEKTCIYPIVPQKNRLYLQQGTRSRQGLLVLDIGKGTTNMSYYAEGRRSDISLPLGGRLITNDIASVLNFSTEEAELIKTSRFSAITAENKPLKYQEKGKELTIIPLELKDIVNSRITEIIQYIDSKVVRFNPKVKEILLVGNCTKMAGMKSMLSKYYNSCIDITQGNLPQGSMPISLETYCAPIGLAKAFLEYNKNLFGTQEVKEMSLFDQQGDTPDNQSSQTPNNDKKSGNIKDFFSNLGKKTIDFINSQDPYDKDEKQFSTNI